MPAIIDSAPDCIIHASGTEAARVKDSADFILQANFQDCAGFMTFGPGSTYGPEGVGANGAYMVVTWIGIIFMVIVLIAWVVYEKQRLREYVASRARGGAGGEGT